MPLDGEWVTVARDAGSLFFPGFQVEDVAASGAVIHMLRKGSGPPLLLLHGYPQTHVIWHKIAERVTERFTVVLTDLRGYGDSSKPEGGARHGNYSFRAMARDQLDVMRHLGYERFAIASHDHGARTAHRLCPDHPEAVSRVCFMDIVPTLRMYCDTAKAFATGARSRTKQYGNTSAASPRPGPEERPDEVTNELLRFLDPEY
jgi:haloacetate dehalogenase